MTTRPADQFSKSPTQDTRLFQLERCFAEEIFAHAQAEAPNECCGLLAGLGGQVLQVYRTRNSEQSPLRYNADPKELLHLLEEIEARGWELLGIYHSHTASEAYPSPTDRRLAFWPDALYFIVSLKDPRQPVLRAFHIELETGQVQEEELALA